MLKIERKTKSRAISVSIKDNGRILTPPFLLAFGIALSFHLLSLLLFQIAPFKIRHAETIFPPVQVKIDYLPVIDSGVLAELENNRPGPTPIPEPPKAKLKIQELPEVPAIKDIAHPKMKKIQPFAFNELWFESYAPDISDQAPIFPGQSSPLLIRLSAGLEDIPYTLPDFDQRELLPASWDKALKRKRVSYRVKIENRTGKIFLYRPTDGEERKKVRSLAEQVLNSLQFKKNPKGFITEGDVELEFLMRERETGP